MASPDLAVTPAGASVLERQPQPGAARIWHDGQLLEKALVMFGFVVATTLLLMFAADLLFAWPFQRASVAFDVITVVSSVALGWMSWNTYRDLR